MSTSVKRRNGGYFTVPNRWVDAGYMAAAPGSVTQVYLHLSRWADNGTLESSQPMKLIAKKCGLSEDVARKAVRTLEAWGVLDRDPDSGRGAKNTWYLNDLPDRAPKYPDKVPPKESGGPDKVGPQESGGTYQPDYYQPNEEYQPEESPKPKRATPLPKDWQPGDDLVVWANREGFSATEMQREMPQFIDHHTAVGNTFKDWDAAFRKWMRNSRKFAKPQRGERKQGGLVF